MGTVWSAEQVLALAPDAGSAKSGKELASARKWVTLGCTEEVLWGECQGSGAAPYQTKVALDEPAYHCSCPSRKFPCKHALGLFLLWVGQPGALASGEPPGWVAAWLEGRARRAEQKEQKEQKEKEREEKREKGEPVVDQAAQRKREAARMAKVAAGLDDLGLWIRDLVGQGLTAVQGKPGRIWDEQARRLIDAQAPGMARRVRQMGGLPLSGEGWQAALLERLAGLHLLVEGGKRLDDLPPEVRADVRAVIGLPIDQDEVRGGPGVRDIWQVVGQRVEVEDRLRTQRTWLTGSETKRAALVLDFAHGTTALDATLPPGSRVDGELAFFPGSAPLRALVKQRHAAIEPLCEPIGESLVGSAYAVYARVLAQSPWLELYPMVLTGVVLQCRGESWWVRDASGGVLPVSPRFSRGWELLGRSGGHPLSLAGEFDGTSLDPLACWVDGRFYPFPAPESEAGPGRGAPVIGPPDLAALWQETAASALVGVERRPPPAPSADSPLAQTLNGLGGIEPPARLLGLAAATVLYGRAGLRPETDPNPPLGPCSADDLPECGPAPAQRLRRLLDGEHLPLLPEWLELLAASAGRIPSGLLADLLAVARRQTDLRPAVRRVLGTRGRWLASLNPEWGFVGGEADQADPEAVWQTGTRAERLAALRALRGSDPARGLALLGSSWSREPADERAAFAGALEVGLSPADEPFLESSLDDRSKLVRRAAADLLAHLPESAYCRRMVERAGAVVVWKNKTLTIAPPAVCDPAMVRDGIEAKPPAKVGERGWWLRQVIAATPLSAWGDGSPSMPAPLIAAAAETEWGNDLWLAWGQAAIRARDGQWSLALLEAAPGPQECGNLLAGLFSVLDPDQRDDFLRRRLEADPGPLRAEHPAFLLLQSLDSPISVGLGRAILERSRRAVDIENATADSMRYDYVFAQFLQGLGRLLPPGMAPDVEALWPKDETAHTFSGTAVEQLKTTLWFRYEMHQEFTR